MTSLSCYRYIVIFFCRIGRILTPVCLCVAIAFGCSKTETITSEEATAQQDKTNQKESLLIGLIPERNIFEQIERYEPLVNYLSNKIGKNIELKVLTKYGNIIDNFISVDMDGAFFGSFAYALAHSKLGVEVLARPQYTDGTSTYHGLIFVRKDSGIKNIKDMKDKTFAFVDRATTAGYLLPLAFFNKEGIKDYNSYLKETYYAGTHEGAIYDVLNKKADIGAAKNTEYLRLAFIDSRIRDELIVLEKSPNVPQNGFAVRRDMVNSVKNKLKETLLNIHNDPVGKKILTNFGAQRFIETTDEDYMNVYKYAEEINLDLSTYDYINN